MQVWDADAHVEEWEGTFADQYFDPALASRRPKVVEGNRVLHWLVDDQVFPRLYGDRQVFIGTPASIGGRRMEGALTRVESLECMELRGPAARLALMDQEGIDMQVLYPTLFLAWPVASEPVLGTAICRSYNNWIADVCNQSGGRLKWVATIDPADPRAAAAEMMRAKQLGAIGTMVLGMAGDRCIAEAPYEPIWATAAEIDMAVAVHVGFCAPLNTFIYSLLMAFDQFIPSGLLDRYPKLRVAFLEAGCQWVPFVMDRMEERVSPDRQASRLRPAGAEAPLSILDTLGARGYRAQLRPKEYLQRGNVFFGFEVEEPLLPWCIEEYGADCFLFASDIPHADRMAGSVNVLLERTDIGETNKQKLLRDTCARFYGLQVSAPVTV
jgi:predicted TIM-barrel fold metal-dependent hydrolase